MRYKTGARQGADGAPKQQVASSKQLVASGGGGGGARAPDVMTQPTARARSLTTSDIRGPNLLGRLAFGGRTFLMPILVFD